MSRTPSVSARCGGWSALLLALLATQLLGCLPMTFSNEGSLDFESLESVYVPPVIDGAGYRSDAEIHLGITPRDYLLHELRECSGFSRITADPNEDVDLVLEVTLDYWEEVEETVTETPDATIIEEEISYEAEATFFAVTPGGRVIFDETVWDESSFLDEAIEDTLDEIVVHFLRPYRL